MITTKELHLESEMEVLEGSPRIYRKTALTLQVLSGQASWLSVRDRGGEA